MAPRKIPAIDSSAKDFLLRKDVPENKNVNGSASKPQMKEEQTSGSGPPSTQITQERPTQKPEIHETPGGNQNLGPQSRQSPATSNLASGGTGTCSKDPPSVKHENPGLASFLSFAPPGVFSTATPAASSHSNEAKKSAANNATSAQTPALIKIKEIARPSQVEAAAVAQTSQLTQKNLEAVTPGKSGQKENGQVGMNGKSPQPVRPVDGNPSSASQNNKAPEARSNKTAPTPKTVLEPKEALKEARQPTPTVKPTPAPAAASELTGPSDGTKQPTPSVEPALKTALKTAPEPNKPSGGENQPKPIAETVFKQAHEPVAALKSLPNGYVKEQPLDDKPSETSSLRPQAEYFSPHPDFVPVPHNSPQPMLELHSPRLMSPVNATAISMDNLQQFIPTGVTTGQLVTTTQVSVVGGRMTPGECRGTLYMRTPVSIQHGAPQPQGGPVPASRASSQEARPHIQLKPTQGLASSRWNNQ
ncbi:unnamed protein product [Clonostachys byssicola]|uniref:Uncharacterized protein n=1 Tax=Clonostachys byssicola TaxID=160290 RepID=A0A9N9UN12_9HYPO|nr:unnamed protein product [Clonostachys byssicola]